MGFRRSQVVRLLVSEQVWLMAAGLAGGGAAALLATLRLVLFLFGRLSLISPLANALAIPVISFIVTPLALLAALLPWRA